MPTVGVVAIVAALCVAPAPVASAAEAASIVAPPDNVVSVGDDFSCAVQSDARPWCWGGGSLGQLGDGTTTTRIEPRRVSVLGQVTEVVTGSSHACALDLA